MDLSDDVRRELRGFLAPEASISNPIDMIATASAADYRRTTEVLVAHEACDAIIAIFVPPLVTAGRDVERELALAGPRMAGITLASVFMGGSDARQAKAGVRGSHVPMFEFPEDAPER